MNPNYYINLPDPIKVGRLLWPHITFYRAQRKLIYSAFYNDETYGVAGNMLGKDFVTAFICLVFFLTRIPCRVVTTSVDYTQLEGVLWGEIGRFVQESKYPLSHEKGGPLIVNHMHLKRMYTFGPHKGQPCPLSYMIGRTAARGEGMLGHHIAKTGDRIPRTMFVADEASGVEDIAYERASTWAERKLIIGNPYPPSPGCTFFYKAIKGGDILAEEAA